MKKMKTLKIMKKHIKQIKIKHNNENKLQLNIKKIKYFFLNNIFNI
jgi:hypothetical protein